MKKAYLPTKLCVVCKKKLCMEKKMAESIEKE